MAIKDEELSNLIKEFISLKLETKEFIKETKDLFKETDKKFKETDEQFKETDKRFKETDEKFKETDEKFKETDKKFKETDKKIKEAFDLFTTQWGRLMESLVEGDLILLLNKIGIKVYDTSTRRKGRRNGINYEFDIIAHNGIEVVIVEVKTTLRPDDVTNFKAKLNNLDNLLPDLKDNVVFGAMAYLQANAGAEIQAQNEGFIVIRATGSSSSIINEKGFLPKKF